ncbi:hypothetical protein B4064_0201 [Caldibacillus thermoamylovorans]|nr:hypothetical protein B4064_0201 [Caldibacillus thermoamylovorans]
MFSFAATVTFLRPEADKSPLTNHPPFIKTTFNQKATILYKHVFINAINA